MSWGVPSCLASFLRWILWDIFDLALKTRKNNLRFTKLSIESNVRKVMWHIIYVGVESFIHRLSFLIILTNLLFVRTRTYYYMVVYISNFYRKDLQETRMHSSGMRTGRSLTVCCSLLPGVGGLDMGGWGVGGVCLVRGVGVGGVCLVRGVGGVCLVRGVGSAWSWGGCLPGPGGFSLPEGCLPGPGGPAWRTPPVDRITDTCKNITLATTSLRPVIRVWGIKYCFTGNRSSIYGYYK